MALSCIHGPVRDPCVSGAGTALLALAEDWCAGASWPAGLGGFCSSPAPEGSLIHIFKVQTTPELEVSLFLAAGEPPGLTQIRRTRTLFAHQRRGGIWGGVSRGGREPARDQRHPASTRRRQRDPRGAGRRRGSASRTPGAAEPAGRGQAPPHPPHRVGCLPWGATRLFAVNQVRFKFPCRAFHGEPRRQECHAQSHPGGLGVTRQQV